MTAPETETCERCGKPVAMTISISAPGLPPSKAICRKCLRELRKQVRRDAAAVKSLEDENRTLRAQVAEHAADSATWTTTKTAKEIDQ